MTDSVMVPREPTIEMMKAASVYCKEGKPKRALDIYRAMLAAAPAPTAGGGEDVWARVSEKARTYARCYPEASDGRNTFILFSEWAEQQAALQSAPAPSGGEVKGRSWSCPSRPREDKHPTTDKLLWEQPA